MKSIRTKILFLSIIIFVIACQSDKEQKFKIIESFQVNEKLVSQIVELDTIPNCPRYLLTAGEFLVLLNYDGCDKYHIHVFDKNTLQFMGAFGTNGRGPNELFAPIPRNVVNNDTLSGIWIYNQRHKKRELVDIAKSLDSRIYAVVNSTDKNIGSYRLMDDSIVNTSLGIKAMIPEISTNLTTDDRFQFYQGEISWSEGNKYIVVAMKNAKRVDIFNTQLVHQVSISYRDSPKYINFNENEEASWHNTYAYFEEIYVNSHNQIYLLVHKRSLSGQLTDEYPEVHVFAMDGKALARYPLDMNQVYLDYFFDEENNCLFGLTYTDEGFHQIIRYHMPELNRNLISGLK